MRNFLKLFGVIALTALIGFSTISCGEDIEETAAGKLIITGFDFADNGFYVWANGTIAGDETIYLFAAKTFRPNTDDIALGEIKNQRITLSVWNTTTQKLFSGSGDAVFNLYVYSVEPVDPKPDPTDDG